MSDKVSDKQQDDDIALVRGEIGWTLNKDKGNVCVCLLSDKSAKMHTHIHKQTGREGGRERETSCRI